MALFLRSPGAVLLTLWVLLFTIVCFTPPSIANSTTHVSHASSGAANAERNGNIHPVSSTTSQNSGSHGVLGEASTQGIEPTEASKKSITKRVMVLEGDQAVEHVCHPPHLVKLNIVFDAVIALAYFSIPIEVAYFYHRHPSPQLFWVFLLFFSFIMLCGITHAIHALTPYELPTLHATFKVLCGLVSIITAVYLVKFIPAALKLPNYAAYLEYEIQERQISETTLRNKNEESKKLRSCTEKIRQTLQMQAIFAEATSSLCNQLDLDSCFCIRYNQTSNRLIVVAPCLSELEHPIHSIPQSLRSSSPDAIATFKSIVRGEHIRLLEVRQLEDLFGKEALLPFTQGIVPLQLSKSVVCTHLSLPEHETALLILARPPDGSVWSLSEIELVRDVANQVEIALAQARSIERDKEMLQELQRNNRALEEAQQRAELATQAKSKFIAIMSHEMRTPLYVVTALTELLMDTPLNVDQRESLATIQTSSRLLLSIISDVLDYSKFQQDNFVMDKAPFNIRTCIEKCIDISSVKAQEAGLDIFYFLHEGFPEVVDNDESRLSQVFLNLLSNAVKFTNTGAIQVEGTLDRYLTNEEIAQLYNTSYGRAENGPSQFLNSTPPVIGSTAAAAATAATTTSFHPISVATTLRNMPPPGTRMAMLHFVVTDTGVGIAEDQLPRLFQEFTQLDTSISRKYEGSGLGLAICRKVVTLMGGSIWVDSAPGFGSSFHFTVVAKVPPPSIAQQLLLPTATFRGLNILLVSPFAPLHRQCLDFGRQTGISLTVAKDIASAHHIIANSTDTPTSNPDQNIANSTSPPFNGILLDLSSLAPETANQEFRRFNNQAVTFAVGQPSSIGLNVEVRQCISMPLKYKSFFLVMRTLAGNPPDTETYRDRILAEVLQTHTHNRLADQEQSVISSYMHMHGISRSTSGGSVSSSSSSSSNDTSAGPSPRRELLPAGFLGVPLHPSTTNEREEEMYHPGSKLLLVDEAVLQNASAASNQSLKILLVEDNAVCRKVCLKQLQKLGFEHVDTAINGQEALDRVAANSYDVALMDVMMPGVDGLCATRAIRKMSEESQVPRSKQPYIIAITASSMLEEGSREACFNAGMDDVVNKPIHLLALKDALLRYFNLRRPDSSMHSSPL